MNKAVSQYLGISYVLSYLCFGAMAYTRESFFQLMQSPFWLLLFAAGCLAPLTATVFVFQRNEAFGGFSGLVASIRRIDRPDMGKLVAYFLVLHYGLAALLRMIGETGSPLRLLQFLPLALLFGSQELGWRLIVQPGLAEARGFWKSTIATGLLWAMWFLPLLFIPGFVIQPDFFMQFAAYLVGAGILLTTIYRQSGSILYCIIFSTLFFALTALFPLKQGNPIVLLAIADIIIAATYQSRLFVKQ